MSQHHRPPSTWPPLGAGWEKPPFCRKQGTLLTRGVHDPSMCESGVSQGNGPNRKELRIGGSQSRQRKWPGQWRARRTGQGPGVRGRRGTRSGSQQDPKGHRTSLRPRGLQDAGLDSLHPKMTRTSGTGMLGRRERLRKLGTRKLGPSGVQALP